MTIRGVGGRYSDIFIYIKVRSIIFGSKFQKSKTFGSMKICGFFFFFFGGGGGGGGVITKSDFFWGGGGSSFLYILGRFKVKIQNGNFFGPQIFRYFWVYLIFLIFFFLGGGGGR